MQTDLRQRFADFIDGVYTMWHVPAGGGLRLISDPGSGFRLVSDLVSDSLSRLVRQDPPWCGNPYPAFSSHLSFSPSLTHLEGWGGGRGKSWEQRLGGDERTCGFPIPYDRGGKAGSETEV